MSGYRRVLLLALLAIWWPATMHCRMEILPGADLLACGEVEADPDGDHCRGDLCDVVEGNAYRASREPHLLPPATGRFEEIPARIARAAETPVGAVAGAGTPDRTPTWLPARHFRQRAAAPARAPSTSV